MKPQPNRTEYLRKLRAMTPDQRLRLALEMTEAAKQRYLQCLRTCFPELDERSLILFYVARTTLVEADLPGTISLVETMGC